MALTLKKIRDTTRIYDGVSDAGMIDHLQRKYGYSSKEDLVKFLAYDGTETTPGMARNLGLSFEQGVAGVGGVVGDVMERTGIAPETGRMLQDNAMTTQQKLRDRQSLQFQRDSAQPLLDENNDINPEYNLSALGGTLAQSLPGMIATAPVGGILGRAATGVLRGAGAGASASNVAGSAVGFGVAEGQQAASQNAMQISYDIRNIDRNSKDFDSLIRTEPFQKAYWDQDEKVPQDERITNALDIVSVKAGDKVFGDTFISTGGIGVATGGGVLGSLRNSILNKSADGFITATLKGMGKEAGQEFFQSGGEKHATNTAKQEYVNPEQDRWQGVLNESATGGLAGGIGGMAGGLSALAPRPVKTTEQKDAEAVEKMMDPATSVDESIKISSDLLSAQTWEEPRFKDIPNAEAIVQNRTIPGKGVLASINDQFSSSGYVPGEHGQVWEQPNTEQADTQHAKNVAYFQAEQDALQRKADDYRAMEMQPDADSQQVKQYRAKRIELEVDKRLRAEAFRDGLGYTDIKYQSGQVENKPFENLGGLLSNARQGQPDLSTADHRGATERNNATPVPTGSGAAAAQPTGVTDNAILNEPQQAPGSSDTDFNQGFVPTHELNDGTPVTQTGENTYVDQSGDEWGSHDARLITSQPTGGMDSRNTQPAENNPGNAEQPSVANSDTGKTALDEIQRPHKSPWDRLSEYVITDKNGYTIDNGALKIALSATNDPKEKAAFRKMAKKMPNGDVILSPDFLRVVGDSHLWSRDLLGKRIDEFELTQGQHEQENQAKEENQVEAAAAQTTSILDPILTDKRGVYLLKKNREYIKANPNAPVATKNAAIKAFSDSYESDVDKASATLAFEQYKALPINTGQTDSLLKMAHEALREEYKITDETTPTQNQPEGNSLTPAAKELRAASKLNESKGDVQLADNGYFVPFEHAVRLAKQGINSGNVRPTPFQLSEYLNLGMRDIDRVIAATAKGGNVAITEYNLKSAKTPADEEIGGGQDNEASVEALQSLVSNLTEGGGVVVMPDGKRNTEIERQQLAESNDETEAQLKMALADKNFMLQARIEATILNESAKFIDKKIPASKVIAIYESEINNYNSFIKCMRG